MKRIVCLAFEWVVLFFISLTGSWAHGEDLEEVDFVEPIIAEESMPNEVGEWDFRISAEYRDKEGEVQASLPRMQLFFGIIDRLGGEIDIPISYAKTQDSEEGGVGSEEYGIGDVAGSLKWLMVEPSPSVPAVVLGFEAGFPTGDEDKELGEGVFEFEPFISAVKDFEEFLVQVTLGWSFAVPEHEGETQDTFSYEGVLAVPFCERKVHVLLELDGTVATDTDTGEDELSVAPGVKYNFTPEVFVALAVPIGLNEETSDWGIVTQFQFGF